MTVWWVVVARSGGDLFQAFETQDEAEAREFAAKLVGVRRTEPKKTGRTRDLGEIKDIKVERIPRS